MCTRFIIIIVIIIVIIVIIILIILIILIIIILNLIIYNRFFIAWILSVLPDKLPKLGGGRLVRLCS